MQKLNFSCYHHLNFPTKKKTGFLQSASRLRRGEINGLGREGSHATTVRKPQYSKDLSSLAYFLAASMAEAASASSALRSSPIPIPCSFPSF